MIDTTVVTLDHIAEHPDFADRKMVPVEINTQAFDSYAVPYALHSIVDQSEKVIGFWDGQHLPTHHALYYAQRMGKLLKVYTPKGEITEVAKPTQPEWETVPLPALSKMRVMFGRYQGRCFEDVPLEYLDWLVGQEWFTGKALVYVQQYLSNPSVATRVDAALAEREAKNDGGFSPLLDAKPQRDVTNPNADPEWKKLRYLSPREKSRAEELHKLFQQIVQENVAKIKARRKKLPSKICKAAKAQLDYLNSIEHTYVGGDGI